MQHEHVVIGGGVYGTYVAWGLARRGADVALLEADSIASGASGGPGKRGVRAGNRDLRELPLMREAYDLWSELGDRLGADVGYERLGQLELIEHSIPRHAPETTAASAPAKVWAQNRHGITSEYLDADAVFELEPDVSDAVVGAVHTPKDGVVDHGALTEALADAARREGATIREGAAVTDISRRSGRVDAVETDDGDRIDVTDTLFVLSNATAPDLLESAFGVRVPTWKMAIQVILTEPIEVPRIEHLIGHAHRRLAMKATGDGRIMITGGWPGEPNDAGDGRAIDAMVEANVTEAVAVYPALDDVGIDQVSVTHQESMCLDEIPIIDAVPGVENALVGTGWSGHGFATAPATGEYLVEWALTGDRPAPLVPFSLERFHGPTE